MISNLHRDTWGYHRYNYITLLKYLGRIVAAQATQDFALHGLRPAFYILIFGDTSHSLRQSTSVGKFMCIVTKALHSGKMNQLPEKAKSTLRRVLRESSSSEADRGWINLRTLSIIMIKLISSIGGMVSIPSVHLVNPGS
jgi:hypothetical protein